MAQRFFDIASALNAIATHDDTSSFEFIFNHFYDKLLRVAIYYLKTEPRAEDAVADVFVKLWDNRRKLKKVKSIDKFLFTMCKNQCLYVIRSNKKIEFNSEMIDIKQRIIIENPESSLISEEFITFFNRKVNELPPKCKLIYLMIKDEGLKYKEVATILNISAKTVENHMSKAIGHIRKCINSYQAYHNRKEHQEIL